MTGKAIEWVISIAALSLAAFIVGSAILSWKDCSDRGGIWIRDGWQCLERIELKRND